MSLPVRAAYTYPMFLCSSSLSRGNETRQGFKPSICSHVFPWSRCSSNYIIEDCPICSAYVCRGHSSYQTLQNISGFFRLVFLSILPLVANTDGELMSEDSARKTCRSLRADQQGSPILWQKQSGVSYWVCEMSPVGWNV